jgi:transketolase
VSRRAFDQTFLSAAYAKLNVRIVGSDPGITAAFNGGTHMSFEDMGILRNIPEMTVLEPTDSTMLADIIRQLADLYGVFYVRLMRKKAIKFYEEGSRFEIGKANRIRDGKDVSLIANGICVFESVKAADLLAQKGVAARVVDMFTLKPIDKDMIIRCAQETGAIVTAENHNIINGLGSAVAEVLVENTPVPMERIGVSDWFGEVGSVDYLKERFSMTAECIADKALRVMTRKRR